MIVQKQMSYRLQQEQTRLFENKVVFCSACSKYDHIKTKKHQKNLENQQDKTLIKRFIKVLLLWVLLWFCADVCGRWLVYMKIEPSCNGFYGDVYKGYRTSWNECLCIFLGETTRRPRDPGGFEAAAPPPNAIPTLSLETSSIHR